MNEGESADFADFDMLLWQRPLSDRKNKRVLVQICRLNHLSVCLSVGLCGGELWKTADWT